jgi:hypothetical protein
MITEKQLTAVEWLVEELTRQNMFMHLFAKEIEKAKEMEKEQIKKAWADGNYNTDSNGNPSENYVISDDSYYQKTFKSE